jgi:flagellar basal body-associated protein FliL
MPLQPGQHLCQHVWPWLPIPVTRTFNRECELEQEKNGPRPGTMMMMMMMMMMVVVVVVVMMVMIVMMMTTTTATTGTKSGSSGIILVSDAREI